MRIAYVVSQFPKISETFILREIIELRRRGREVVIVSLKPAAETLVHAEAEAMLPDTLYPADGRGPLKATLRFLLAKPARLASAVGAIAWWHAGSPVMLAKSLALIPAALHAAAKLRGMDVRHVHAHWATYPATAAWLISRMTGIPYSVTAHAHDIFLPNPMLAAKLRDATFLATISEFNRALLIQRFGPAALGKIRLVRCGLPLEEFPFSARPPEARGGPPVVASVGRLVDYKGFEVLVRACGRLRDRGLRVRCVIVGEGPERRRLERIVADLRLDGDVTLAGGRRQDEVRAIVAQSDLFALACRRGGDGQQDGIPIVLMEAMALGVPVISTRLSGIPELVVDNRTGILVAPDDDAHLADGMERLLTDRALARRLAAAAREHVEKEFDVRRWAALLGAEFPGANGVARR